MDFETLTTTMQAETSQVVKYWMRWMMAIFFISIAFIPKFKTARWTFLTIIGTIVLAIITWRVTKNVHLFGIPHLILWTPLAFYLWKTTLSAKARANRPSNNSLYSKAHMVWVVLIFVTILICLPFDIRDIYLVAMGIK